MSKHKVYEVKQKDGQTYSVFADNYSVSCDGLQFFREEKRVAWFTDWTFFGVSGSFERS